MKSVEQTLVDGHSPYGLSKKSSCDEAGNSTEKVEQSATILIHF
jgi:hypothetical protein